MMMPGNTHPSDHAGEATRCGSRNPYLFIVGCPRSGTTLLERMVNAHPQLAIIHETHWITRYYKKQIGLTPEGFVTPKLISKLCEYHRFSHLHLSRAELEGIIASETPVSYADFVSRIFDLYGEREGKRMVGDKTTGGYVRNVSTLNVLWPNARFVHLIRDGRDVCLSMLQWPKAHRAAGRFETWAEDPVSTTALWWKWHVELGMEQGRPLGPGSYYEMRYESLVEDPADECAVLCAFLGVPFDDAMLKFHEGHTKTESGLSANQAWIPPTPGIRDWRTQMDQGDVELFEAIAGDCLSALGYERVFDGISPPIAARAEQCRSRWQTEKDQRPSRSSQNRLQPAPRTETTARPSTRAANNPVTNTHHENPYLFIVGCPRSGTTLLKRMVNAHPQIALTRETHWITRYYKNRLGVTTEGLVTPELIPKLFKYHRFPHLKISRDELEAILASDQPISYADFVSRIFDLYGQRCGKRLVGDKTPGYVRNIPLLHELWPKVRFVHLIRDVRDVCLSMSQWRMAHRAAGRFSVWKEDPVSTAALWWKWHVQLGIEGGRPLGVDLYHEVRYESLVQSPADQCMALCAFLGLPHDAAMVKFHEGRTKRESGLSANRAWLPATPGIRDWRSDMPAEDVERIEAAVGDLLDELGYSRAFPRPKAQMLKHASRIRDLFTRDARADRTCLPQGW
ncbi:MAG: sulfotransferase [Phycisphaerales bacterium]